MASIVVDQFICAKVTCMQNVSSKVQAFTSRVDQTRI